MARDFYLRDPSDPNFRQGVLEINDELEMLLNQIKMILFTNKGEVLGDPDFGINLEEQLFTFNVNEFSLKNMLRDQLLKFCTLSDKYRVDFDIKFARGTVRDICLIDIVINGSPVMGVLVK